MAMTLLQTNTLDADSVSAFTSSIDSTYKLYVFKFISIHAETDNAHLFWQANVSGASGYNEPVTAASYNALHNEDDSAASLQYDTGWDQATQTANSGTGIHTLIKLGSGNDECGSGELFVFDPSSTTYFTHWMARGVTNSGVDICYDNFEAGYFNVTGAVTQIQFSASTGNLDTGTIKMYGVG